MIGLTNRAGISSEGVVAFDVNGEQSFVVIAKATYEIVPGADLRLHAEQVPVAMADQHWGEPGVSSVRYEADIAPHKRHADLVLNATAWAPRGRSVTQISVELSTRTRTKRLLVTGDRRWVTGLGGMRSTPPEPFVKMPLIYERAFGGTQAASGAVDIRNPVGVGYSASSRDVDGRSLPNIEDPRAVVARWNDKPAPAGVAAVGRSWQPRSKYAGTYDQRWMDERFPFLPLDFDDRYFLSAPEDQQLAAYVSGEPILLRNMSPQGDLLIHLPDFSIAVYVRTDRRRLKLTLKADSVLIEPDLGRVIITGRLRLPLGRKPDALRHVVVGQFTAGEERAFLTGKRYLSGPDDAVTDVDDEQDQ